MIAPVHHSARPGQLLTEGWTLTLTEADAYSRPSDIPLDAEAITAPVPGTVAEALEAVGKFDRFNPTPLNGLDAWYRLTLISDGPQRATLHFDGLATIAEIYLNGEVIANSTSMFEAQETPVQLTGADELAICFRALAPRLERSGPRARWRPQMMNTQGLRMIRTTALGYMPGWCPEIHAAGPWRSIRLIRGNEANFEIRSFRAELTKDGAGVVKLSVEAAASTKEIEIECNGHKALLSPIADGLFEGELRLEGIEPWWPATHGKPTLHDVTLRLDGKSHPIGKTGFRRVEIDHGADGKGFGLKLNGEPIFCRGAVWTNADIVRLPGNRKDYEPWLRLAAEAGMNMIRIGGTMAYETADFFTLCDELGLMVWQDMMLANFDYPTKDEAFLAHIETETTQLLAKTALSPSLAVLCGGSEIYQQGAMLGLSETFWKGPLTEEILPNYVQQHRPDIVYVPNSPFGGALPFVPNEKVGHYYGVGAYCRPLDDARRANVRLAGECLAFANVPQQKTLEAHLPVRAFHDPVWKSRIPRDRGASWDFEDVRDHYLKLLYDADPTTLRREDGERYLDLSRAAIAEVMETTFGEWRHNGSSCQGALVWTLQDLLPGPGWGLIDSTGEPKSTWYALKRAFRPVQIILTDEGTNGLHIHLLNETGQSRNVVVELACLRDGLQPVVSGRRQLELGPRTKITLAATDLFGAFFDTTYAYRFGPPSHDVTVARLRDVESGEVVASAYHFPLGRSAAMHSATLTPIVSQKDDRCFLTITSDRFAQSVHVAAENHRPADDWFHLAPGESRTIELFHTSKRREEGPHGEIRALGSRQLFRF
ncbi:glycoside hydrolase family 2 protein [Agrobacterium larrymoorei]|uniref:beta-mannosidase n=1 Tax=Agrobacterium larrymoorei TaxID=160699 RepID=A0AAF0KDZ2_9HYPH|nr:glycoside hydrolase family 2 protein [Agrobacterium larrymoorei]WHA41518.1 glycoside hydrolase family 2 protein [Agrobacterium larrymoorei]